jgi:hypothetical protein
MLWSVKRLIGILSVWDALFGVWNPSGLGGVVRFRLRDRPGRGFAFNSRRPEDKGVP